jgi:hypothetical protein
MQESVAKQIERIEEYLRGDAGRDNYGRLVQFTESLSARYWWYSSLGSSMPGGLSPADIVGELMTQVLAEDKSARERRRIPEDVDVEKALTCPKAPLRSPKAHTPSMLSPPKTIWPV